jgi:hypothetical protein
MRDLIYVFTDTLEQSPRFGFSKTYNFDFINIKTVDNQGTPCKIQVVNTDTVSSAVNLSKIGKTVYT